MTVTSGSGSVGLFSHRSASGNFTATVLVLPKLWGQQGSGTIEQRDGHVRVAVLLSEYASVSLSLPKTLAASDSNPANDFRASVMELSRLLSARKKRWKVNARSERPGQSTAGEDDSAAKESAGDEDDIDPTDASEELDRMPVDCGLRFELKWCEPTRQASHDLASCLRDLVWLCYRNRKMKSSSDEGGGDETGGLLLDPKTDEEQDPLALLAELDFVSEMDRLQRRIRKGYVPEEDRLAAIRGRITDRGVLDFEMTGIPLLECRFDEFVEATPLFRVLVTALDVVASGALRDTLGVGNDWFGGQSDLHPATLREQLRSIPSLPLPVARATADRLRLTRLQQEWQRPLDLARRILRAESTRTGGADSEGGATIWSIDMPALWERLLAQAFNRQPNWRATEQDSIVKPWLKLGGRRRVDVALHNRTHHYLLDAKYKHFSRGVSAADQNQMFVYSDINADPPDAVALVYPSATEACVTAHGEPSPRQETNLPLDPSKLHKNPSLHLITARFPGPETARDAEEWGKYLKDIGAEMVAVLAPASLATDLSER